MKILNAGIIDYLIKDLNYLKISVLVSLIIGALLLSRFIFVVIQRIEERKKEDFEKRDN